ncbi:MAG: hypothetical protein IKT46_10085 [Clostridia bacterium]|nr:hypothetical protein [Clostridia bacterium]
MEKREFSLLDILQLLKSFWWILLIAAIVFAGIGAAYSVAVYDPVYSSSVEFYVIGQSGQNDDASDDATQVKWAKDVVNSYVEILKANSFLEDVSAKYEADHPEEWEAKTYSAIKLAKCTKYTIKEDTYIFTITVTTHDPDVSCNIARIFETEAPARIKELEKRDAIQPSDYPRPADTPSNSRNLGRNAILGFLIGAILAFLVVLVIDLSDIRIKDEDDIIDNYTVPLLGSVPNFESAKKKGYGYGKK